MDAFKSDPSPGKRRLVEECETISVVALQRSFGKKALLSKIRAAEPLLLPVSGGRFEVWLTYETHRLPGAQPRYASLESGTARLWLICAGCMRPAAKLFFYYVGPGTSGLSNLRCQRCQGLIYLSANSGKNKWFRELVRPLKRLKRRRECVEKWTGTARRDRLLAQIDEEIDAFRLEHNQKRIRNRVDLKRRSGLHERRPYRDMSLYF
jgi:hypothetical protein